ncbi:Thioesterase/thiol ester dehydrase-isomerase [Xylaria intraflava]|nr:Thioesterase/thiol ester dehydrase-isomerase [Xylaria intraflava]
MTLPSAEAVRKGHGRLPYQEALSLMSLPDKVLDDGRVVKRYMSRHPAWVPGNGFIPLAIEQGIHHLKPWETVYGGHVYSQASLAASLAFRATAGRGARDRKFGIHTIHGFFSEAGIAGRPFIYEVTNLASNASFPNLLVTARQPSLPSRGTEGARYPKEDADLPLGPVRFSAMVSFRPASISQLDVQEPSPQARFAGILASRRPMEWDPAPILDIEETLKAIPGSRQAVGVFPVFEMRKVDLRAYNAGRPLHERRELILYRLLAPLPATASTSVAKAGDECEIGGPDAHICAHAFGADRNGLLMIGDNVGFGNELSRAASLSYSLVVHVDAEEAVMTYSKGDDQWWVLEGCFPRLQAGRGILHSKIWSPRGVHVASEYQDGILRRRPRTGEEKGKL